MVRGTSTFVRGRTPSGRNSMGESSIQVLDRVYTYVYVYINRYIYIRWFDRRHNVCTCWFARAGVPRFSRVLISRIISSGKSFSRILSIYKYEFHDMVTQSRSFESRLLLLSEIENLISVFSLIFHWYYTVGNFIQTLEKQLRDNWI